ncbi:MAG TPA: serine--tRNA ligase, partial [Cyanobacteria bacterium UBA11166]|nr:serine--tRNA ligase [Cyanobacteria bacterium UBA11166]
MLDLKQIRENPQVIQELLNRRGVGQYDLTPILELNQRQRELETSRTRLQARSNEIGKLIGQKIKAGSLPDAPEMQELRDEG